MYLTLVERVTVFFEDDTTGDKRLLLPWFKFKFENECEELLLWDVDFSFVDAFVLVAICNVITNCLSISGNFNYFKTNVKTNTHTSGKKSHVPLIVERAGLNV